jgi:zinc transporter, ZIP family
MTPEMLGYILIPFAGTSLGAALVFFMKDGLSERTERILGGFAAGVMVAASFWSLLAPALEQAEEALGSLAFIPCAIGFLLGMALLLILDTLTPHMHLDGQELYNISY